MQNRRNPMPVRSGGNGNGNGTGPQHGGDVPLAAGSGGNGTGDAARRLRSSVRDRLQFLQAFLRSPAAVGAVGPSSVHLAREMVAGCRLDDPCTVVELGPGTGAFTGLILRRIGKEATFFALELDEQFTAALRRRFPDLTVYNDSAERIPQYLAAHSKEKADYIVCGLPWASLPMAVQDRVFRAVVESLRPGGVFATFGYVHARWMPNAKRFRRRLESVFSRVETSPVVWRNFPPAFIYRCTR